MFERKFTEEKLQYITKCRNCGRDEYHHTLFYEPGRNTYVCEYCLPEINKFEEQEFLNRLQNSPREIFSSFIPPAYLDVTYTSFIHTDSQFINRVINAAIQNKSLCLMGANNTGKTTVLWILFKHLVTSRKYHPRSIIFERTCDLRDKFIQGVQENFIFNTEKYKLAKLLLLDDLTAVNITPALANVLYSILNYRSDFEKPTFVTTDADLIQLSNFDKRIAARVSRFPFLFNTGVNA